MREEVIFSPTDAEINSYVSAWDGDITEKEARYLLEIDFWKFNSLVISPELGKFTKRIMATLEDNTRYGDDCCPKPENHLWYKACYIIDRLSAENKSQIERFKAMRDCNTTRIRQLQAELKESKHQE